MVDRKLSWHSSVKTVEDKVEYIAKYLKAFTPEVLDKQKKQNSEIEKLEKDIKQIKKENQKLISDLDKERRTVRQLKTDLTELRNIVDQLKNRK